MKLLLGFIGITLVIGTLLSVFDNDYESRTFWDALEDDYKRHIEGGTP